MKRLLCLVLCLALLCGCAPEEESLTARGALATPAGSQSAAPEQGAAAPQVQPTTSAIAPAPKAPAEVPSGMDGVFTDWAAKLTFAPGTKQAKYYGVAVDGSREGNLLTVKQAKGGGYLSTRITLTAAAGKAAELTLRTERYYDEFYLFLQCVDLDGDGTDELLLQFDFMASGGTQDTHVLALQDGALVDTLAILNPNRDHVYDDALLAQYEGAALHCIPEWTGVTAVPYENGYALMSSRHAFDAEANEHIRFHNMFYYESGAWRSEHPVGAPQAVTHEDDKKRLRQLLHDDARLKAEDLRVYYSYAPTPANLDDLGTRDDSVYLHQATYADATPLAVVEARLHAGKTLVEAFWRNDIQGCYMGVGDLDGDGVSEITLVLGAERGGCEVHVLKPSADGLTELLTLQSGVGELTFAYSATYQDAGVPFRWCNIEEREGKDMLALYQQGEEGQGSNTVYYGWIDGEWRVE